MWKTVSRFSLASTVVQKLGWSLCGRRIHVLGNSAPLNTFKLYSKLRICKMSMLVLRKFQWISSRPKGEKNSTRSKWDPSKTSSPGKRLRSRSRSSARSRHSGTTQQSCTPAENLNVQNRVCPLRTSVLCSHAWWELCHCLSIRLQGNLFLSLSLARSRSRSLCLSVVFLSVCPSVSLSVCLLACLRWFWRQQICETAKPTSGGAEVPNALGLCLQALEALAQNMPGFQNLLCQKGDVARPVGMCSVIGPHLFCWRSWAPHFQC